MRILKGILSFIFAVILAMAIIMLVILNIANNTILNEEFIISNLTDSFYSEVYAEIKEEAEEYLEGTDFEGLDIEEIISEEKVRSDLEMIIEDMYNGNQTDIDTSEIEENINTEITKMIGKTTASLVQDTINEFATEVCEVYETQLESLNNSENSETLEAVFEYVDKLILYAEIAVAVCAILVVMLSLPKINKGILKFGIVFEIDGIVLAVLGKFANQLVEEVEANTMGLEKIVYNILDTVLNYGYIFVAVGFVCILVSELFARTNKTRKTTYSEMDDDE